MGFWWSKEARANRLERRLCREGVQRCRRCQDMMDQGLNPYTGEPLGSMPGALITGYDQHGEAR